MMQRLLFGPPSADIRYEDLRRGEIAVMAVLLLVIVGLSFMPRAWLHDPTLARATFVEWTAWRK